MASPATNDDVSVSVSEQHGLQAAAAAISSDDTAPATGTKRKLARTALSLREKAIVKSFCEQKVTESKARGELVPSQELLRREVASQFGWTCGRSTLSKILSMDWRALRGGHEGGDAPRNTNMKRRRRPLFPAFEADLVKFITAHLGPATGDSSGVLATDIMATEGVPPPPSMVVGEVGTAAEGSVALPASSTIADGGAERAARGRVLTEALILEEAQRLKQVHGVTDEELVLSVGWLARFKHRNDIRLRKATGGGGKSPQHQPLGIVTATDSDPVSMGAWSTNLTAAAPTVESAALLSQQSNAAASTALVSAGDQMDMSGLPSSDQSEPQSQLSATAPTSDDMSWSAVFSSNLAASQRPIMCSFRLRIKNARQIVQVCAQGELFKAGAAQKELAVLENASLVVDLAGHIAAVGPAADVEKWLSEQLQPVIFEKDVNARDLVVLPGFVDAHTHPVWSGNRVNEFAMKLAGATYMEVHESGGGINNTVRATKQSSEAELTALLRARLDRMLRSGTTLVEAKSGYGLEAETELKMLRVLHSTATGKDAHPVEIVSNFLGGHSVPDGMTAAAATEDIVKNQIPAVVQAKQDGTISPEFIDVFCEKGVFEYDDTRRILEAGKQAGLEINFHGDEMHPMRSGAMAAALGARAISHCEMLTADDLDAMAAHKPQPVFAVLLPTTKYILKLPNPPAREMISAGVPVALGSDFNPNAHCLSMALTMNMACVQFGMTMKEALVGATINAAASINRSATHGSLEVGKQGDLVLLRASQWEQVIYEMGDPPIAHVVKKGVFYPTN